MTLNRDTVFVITGAAGSITSAITADLAASGGTFYLLDLTPTPDRNDPHIALFRTDKEALKRKLIEDARASGERPTPVQIDRQIAAIERQEAALRAIEAVEAAGGSGYYYSTNLLDAKAVAAVMDNVRQNHGRIDVLIHAGGLEISHLLPDKDLAQFSLVFDVKSDGFFNLLRAAQGIPIGATVAFSSVAGRFGNGGQTDYSAANDLLCKMTSSLRRWRPETRGIVIDWTAWSGIGMASRGSIPKMMEMAGIDMLPPESGIPTVRRELTVSDFRGEVVVGTRLGILMDEWDTSGGLDTERAAGWLTERRPGLLMVGSLKRAPLHGGLEVETVLDPKIQPFLHDHQLGGTPLLPGVMGVEMFAELASALAPGYTVAGAANVEFQTAFKFYRMEPQTLHLNIIARPAGQGTLIAHTVLRSVRQPTKAGTPLQVKTHFIGDIHLTRQAIDSSSSSFSPPPTEAMPITAEQIYRLYFHGPAYQVLERAQVKTDEAIGLMAAALPPNSEPADAASLMAPRCIELCFQTAGLWEIVRKEVMALPTAIRSVRIFRQPEAAGANRLYAVVRAINDGEEFDAEVVDENGTVYITMSSYRTVKLPGSVTLEGT